MPRDYLSVYQSPNDSRPVITEFDPLTGRPYQGYDSESGHIVDVTPIAVEAPSEPVEAQEAVEATPVAEAPVEAAVEAPEGLVEAVQTDTPVEVVETPVDGEESK